MNFFTRTGRRAAAFVRPAFTGHRLLHVFKTALAATIAWYAGHLIPGEANAYAYYAPLGALVASVPVVAASLRSSLQVVLGVLVGVLASGALFAIELPVGVAVPVAVGIGTLLAGIPGLGAGRDYIPIAALFVFVVGGANPDGFSFSYVLQMTLGAAIGLAINVIIPPAIGRGEANEALRALGEKIADSVADAAAAPSSDDTADALESWKASLAHLDGYVDAAGVKVNAARENRRGNARTLAVKFDGGRIQDIFESNRRMVRHLFELKEPLSASTWEAVSDEVLRALNASGANLSDLVRRWAHGDTDLAAAVKATETSLDDLQRLDAEQSTSWDAATQRRSAMVYALRKLTAEVEYRIETDATPPEPPKRGPLFRKR